MLLRQLCGFSAVLFAAAACSGKTVGSQQENGGVSPTCARWQDAICDFGADLCAAVPRATCEETTRAIHCKSDDVTQACLDQLTTAECSGGTPPSCTLQAIADRAPAIAACNQYIREVCAVSVRCQQSASQADCEASVATRIDCSAAIGVAPSFSACIAEVRRLGCTEAELPAVCDGVIKVTT